MKNQTWVKIFLSLFILQNSIAGLSTKSIERIKRQHDWNNFIKKTRSANLSPTEVANRVNNYFNENFKFLSDGYATSGRAKQTYSSLDDMIRKGGGDCEDFAIAKMATMARLGIDRSKLKLVLGEYITERGKRLPHAVLYFLPDKFVNPIVLDNLIKGVVTPSKLFESRFKPKYELEYIGDKERGKISVVTLGKRARKGEIIKTKKKSNLKKGITSNELIRAFLGVLAQEESYINDIGDIEKGPCRQAGISEVSP